MLRTTTELSRISIIDHCSILGCPGIVRILKIPMDERRQAITDMRRVSSDGMMFAQSFTEIRRLNQTLVRRQATPTTGGPPHAR
jgi:hypothetical protein